MKRIATHIIRGVRAFFSHLLEYGETFIVLPVFTLFVVAAIGSYHWWKGRDNADDPIAAMIHTLNAFGPSVALLMFVGYIQSQFIGFRHPSGKMQDAAFDLAAFLSLYWTAGTIAHIL